MKKLMLVAVLTSSMIALAGPPPGLAGKPRHGDPALRMEEGARRARTMYVVAIAEALELSEADALKLSEKLKAVEGRRAPVRQQMMEAMRAVKAAADGDPAALAEVDAHVATVLDGRAQMAAMDKELFTVLARDYSPQQRAKLALVLARMGQLKRGGAGRR